MNINCTLTIIHVLYISTMVVDINSLFLITFAKIIVIYITAFTQHNIYLITRHRYQICPHYLLGKLNVWIETFYDTLESLLLTLFIYKYIIPVRNDITHWAIYIYNPLFCTSRSVHLCEGRRFWVRVGRVEYGNLFYLVA